MLSILFICWRDHHHPQGGGAEKYQQEIAQRLSAKGYRVSIITARYPGSAAYEYISGVHYYRIGGKYSIYPHIFARLWCSKWGIGSFAAIRPDIIIDTQNGIPFWASLTKLAPTILLIHHCHKHQWFVAGKILSTIGWWIESKLSPAVHRHNHYVTVSPASREDLIQLGVDAHRITIIGAGITTPPHLPSLTPPTSPTLVVLSRLVPHKQIEHAIDAVRDLSPHIPDLSLHIIGDGWWRKNLTHYAHTQGVASQVIFHGYVTETRKYELLAASTVHVMPSTAEGWCLAVTEAGAVGVPSVGYTHSRGLNNSIIHNHTGYVVDTYEQWREKIYHLLTQPPLRSRLGAAAKHYATSLNWDTSTEEYEALFTALLTRSGSSPATTDNTHACLSCP